MTMQEPQATNPLEGFRKVEPVEFGPMVPKTALGDGNGVPCTYLHTQIRGDAKNKVHTFRVGQKLFGVWGDAGIDAMLRAIKPGTYVFLEYHGKVDEGDGFQKHRWSLYNGAQLSAEQRATTEQKHATSIRLLGDAIDRARTSRQDAPSHTDDDFPFGT